MNTDKITTYLEQLELSPLETKIYLTLLHEDGLTPQDLIKKLRVHRTSIYPPLESLFSRGLISKSVKGKQTRFSVTDPEKSLQTVLEKFTTEKKEQLKKMELAFPEILMKFPKIPLGDKETNDAETKLYKGRAGVKKVYEEVFRAKENRSYVDSDKVLEVFPENLSLFSDALERNPEMKMFEIFQSSFNFPEKAIETFAMKKNYSYKYLPKGAELTAQDIFIYENKIAIISISKEVSAVVLQNRDLYKTFKALFDVMWKLLPEVKRK